MTTASAGKQNYANGIGSAQRSDQHVSHAPSAASSQFDKRLRETLEVPALRIGNEKIPERLDARHGL